MSKLLIFSTDSAYSGLARLPKALKDAGFEVAALCRENAFLAKTRYLDQLFLLSSPKSSRKLLKQLVAACQIWQPDFIICGDETTVVFAHYVIQHVHEFADLVPETTLKVLKFSLGDSQHFRATLRKHETLEAAEKLGLRIPGMIARPTWEEALQFAETYGYPVVLKQDFSWSGAGVKICLDADELRSAMATLSPRPPSASVSQVRRLLKRDWMPRPEALSLQQFIPGKTAMFPSVALDGEVLAGFAAVKELTSSRTGPSSVVRLTNHHEMQKTVTELMQYFRFSGFASFDFMIEEGTDHAYLVECNPRPVPVCHLGALVGVNLCQALFNRLNQKSVDPKLSVEAEQLIALFPQEWRRQPDSPHLKEIYHDVPWDDPALVKAYIA